MNEYRVCSANDNARWLEERKQCVTGSGLAYLMGYVPHYEKGLSEDELREKLMTKYLHGDEFKVGRAAYWGRECEETNIHIFCKAAFEPGSYCVEQDHGFYRRGLIGSTTDAVLVLGGRATIKPKCIATSAGSYWAKYFQAPLESELAQGNYKGLIEAKQTRERYKKDWGSAGPPLNYWAQCQAQMYVTGLPWCILFARIGSDDLRAHLITPDELFMEEAERRVNVFWEELSHRKEKLGECEH